LLSFGQLGVKTRRNTEEEKRKKTSHRGTGNTEEDGGEETRITTEGHGVPRRNEEEGYAQFTNYA